MINLSTEIKLIRRPQNLFFYIRADSGAGFAFLLFIRHNQIFPLALVERVDYSNPITRELFYNSIFTSSAYQRTSRTSRISNKIH